LPPTIKTAFTPPSYDAKEEQRMDNLYEEELDNFVIENNINLSVDAIHSD
jgi:hypothetical protein